MQTPSLNLAFCTDCGACMAVAPEYFQKNSEGRLELVFHPTYVSDVIDEAIKYCPHDCISWETI